MCKYISKSVKKLLVEICQVVHSGNKRKYAKYPWKIHAIFPFLLDVLFCGRAHRNFLVEFCCCVLSLFLRSWKCKLRMTHLTFLLGKLWEAFFFCQKRLLSLDLILIPLKRPQQHDWLNAKYVARNHVTKRLMQESWSCET